MKPRFYQNSRHGNLSALRSKGRVLFPLSGITGVHQLGRFGAEWIASYADKHPMVPVKTKDGRDHLLHETTVMDFISTLIDDVDLVDWLINSVMKDLHGIKEPEISGTYVVGGGRTNEDVMNPRNSVSTWLLHPMLAPHLGYSQWIQSLVGSCTLGQARRGIRIGKRPDGTIAIHSKFALDLGMEAVRFPSMVACDLMQHQVSLSHYESLTTFDSILRRHSVMI